MNEESVINWGSIITILLGIAIVSSVVLILYLQKRSRRRGHKRKFELHKSNEKITSKDKKTM